MADREKVLKGLECLITNETPCEGCPYNGSGHCMKNIAKDARELLKEQEPIAPKLIKMYPHDIYECGNCKHKSVGSKDYKAKYCPECGKELNWDGC